MQQGIAKHVMKTSLTFATLTFSLFAGLGHAQNLIEVEAPPSALQNESLNTQPVSLSAGMVPVAVPQAQAQAQAQSNTQVTTTVRSAAPMQQAPTAYRREDGALVVSAPSTGIGGSNPGNANTGGVQVQSVNVQASPVVDASTNRNDLLRRERMRQELNNESRLMERLEEGRVSDEARRLRGIEGFKSSVGDNQLEQTSVNTASTTAIADHGSTATATTNIIAPVKAVGVGVGVDDVEVNALSVDRFSDVRFRIAPFLGYRWAQNTAALNIKNQYMTGIGMEGQINRYVGIEGSFSYAKDEFTAKNGYYGAGPAGYGQAGYGGAPAGYDPYSGGGSGCGGCSGFIRSRSAYEVAAGVKVGNQFYRARPFVAAGMGGQFNKYKIDDPYTTAAAEAAGWSRSTSHVFADFGSGLDFGVSRNFSVGARFDYVAILNKRHDAMNFIYGDSSNSYRVMGSAQLVF